MEFSALPKNIQEILADASEDTREYFCRMYTENNSELRETVLSALQARGEKVDLIQLEFAMTSVNSWDDIKSEHAGRDAKAQKDFKKKFLKVLKKTATDEEGLEKRRESFFYYLKHEFSDYFYAPIYTLLEQGPAWPEHRNTDLSLAPYLKMLNAGEDAKLVLMLLVNAWGNRRVFRECVRAFGGDILAWDDKRSIVYQSFFDQPAAPQKLCDEIYVEPAALAFIEPLTYDDMASWELDIYGTRVADVTTYAIRFKPLHPSMAKDLQKALEGAIRKLAEAEFPFSIPRDHGARAKAYDRPEHPEMVPDYGGTKNIWDDFIEDRRNYLNLFSRAMGDLPDFQEKSFTDEEEALKAIDIKTYWSQQVYGCPDKAFKTHFVHEYVLDLWRRGLPLPEGVPAPLLQALKDTQERLDAIRYTKIDDDGCVRLNHALALDDVWDLYALCRPFVEPSEQIAAALNSARYAEERGPIQSFKDLGQHDFDYGYNGQDDESVLGNLHDVPEEKRLMHGLAHIAMMMGQGISDKETALAQIMQMADATLKGAVHDSTGIFPTYRAITDGRAGHAVVAYTDVAAERTRQMVEAVSVMFGEKDASMPLRQRFENAAANAGKIAALEQQAREALRRYDWSVRNNNRMSDRDFHPIDPDDDRARNLSDILSGKFRRLTDKEQAEEDLRKKTAVVNRAELALWAGAVAPQVDRSYANTAHVTRSRHSPFVRLELPDDLQPFIKAWEKRHGRERYQLPDPRTIFSI